jgi:Flp pilus assembly protein TadD
VAQQPEPAGASADPTASGQENGQAAFFIKLGNRALRDGDTTSATDSFNKARVFDRTNADAIAGLGAAAMAEGKYADAVVHLEAAARLKPRSARIHALRGQAYLAAGRRSEAAAAFRRSLELEPGNRSATQGLSEASGAKDEDDDGDDME